MSDNGKIAVSAGLRTEAEKLEAPGNRQCLIGGQATRWRRAAYYCAAGPDDERH